VGGADERADGNPEVTRAQLGRRSSSPWPRYKFVTPMTERPSRGTHTPIWDANQYLIQGTVEASSGQKQCSWRWTRPVARIAAGPPCSLTRGSEAVTSWRRPDAPPSSAGNKWGSGGGPKTPPRAGQSQDLPRSFDDRLTLGSVSVPLARLHHLRYLPVGHRHGQG